MKDISGIIGMNVLVLATDLGVMLPIVAKSYFKVVCPPYLRPSSRQVSGNRRTLFA